MSNATKYGVLGILVGLVTGLIFAYLGGSAYMFVLFGGGLSIVLLGMAYDKHRLKQQEQRA